MAEGWSTAAANAILNAYLRSTPLSEPDAIWVKLHIGAPGSAGTSNPAVETTRKQATFGTNASGGSISNTVAITWSNVAASEDYTHFTAWDASSGGNFLFSGPIVANPVTAGEAFTGDIGSFNASIPVAS